VLKKEIFILSIVKCTYNNLLKLFHLAYFHQMLAIQFILEVVIYFQI